MPKWVRDLAISAQPVIVAAICFWFWGKLKGALP